MSVDTGANHSCVVKELVKNIVKDVNGSDNDNDYTYANANDRDISEHDGYTYLNTIEDKDNNLETNHVHINSKIDKDSYKI